MLESVSAAAFFPQKNIEKSYRTRDFGAKIYALTIWRASSSDVTDNNVTLYPSSYYEIQRRTTEFDLASEQLWRFIRNFTGAEGKKVE